jgi:hypothetical protein
LGDGVTVFSLVRSGNSALRIFFIAIRLRDPAHLTKLQSGACCDEPTVIPPSSRHRSID